MREANTTQQDDSINNKISNNKTGDVLIRHKEQISHSTDSIEKNASKEKSEAVKEPEAQAPNNTKLQKEKFYLDINVQTKIFAVLLMIFSVLLFFALVSHTTKDDSNTQFSFSDIKGIFTDDPAVRFKFDTTMNLLGLLGAYISDFLINGFIGILVIGFPVILFLWGRSIFRKGEVVEKLIIHTNIYILFATSISIFIGSLTLFSTFENIPKEFYGTIGIFIPTMISRIFFPVGAFIISLGILAFLLYKFTTIKSIGVKQTISNAFAPINPKLVISKLNELVNAPDKKKTKEQIFRKHSSNSTSEDIVENINTIVPEATATTTTTTNNNNNNNGASNSETVAKNNSVDYQIREEIETPKIRNIFNDVSFNYAEDFLAPNNFDDKNTASEVFEDETLKKFRNKVNIKIIKEPSEENVLPSVEALSSSAKEEKNTSSIVEEVVLPLARTYIPSDLKTTDQILSNPPVNLDTNISTSNLKIISQEGAFTPNIHPAVSTSTNNSNIGTTTTTTNNNNNNINSRNDSAPRLIMEVEPELQVQNSEEKLSLKNPLSVSVHDEKINYTSPLLDLLDIGSGESYANDEELQRNGQILQEKLQQFKINISNLEVTKGPVVTQYEFVPADGIKISKVEGLADDLTMALKAKSVRIIAPVPEKGTVGIQIPNANPSIVRFRSVASSSNFINNNFELPIALGKTVSGEPFVADLAKMPHLLIAGSTGSGKSVGINTIITSLLFRKHPNQLKFLIVDPKKVELQQYSKLSNHFLAISPDIKSEIVTEPSDAITALKSVVLEMEKRYSILAKVGQRNIKDYNEKIVEGAMLHIKDFDHRALPYIVVVIDELADLMLTAGKEVETPIVRLAQMARAVGIHLIIATQRPSVNVITGVIKANFPARIAYLVAQKVDSRTILDSSGAEALLGNGDMLFQPSNQPKPIRVQNPFISTDEVERVCEFIGSQQGYSEPYLLPSTVETTIDGEYDITEFDPLFREAAELIIDQQQASTSMLQRRLKIGFARAGRIIDELESAKIIGPSQGSKPRAVYLESISDLDKIL